MKHIYSISYLIVLFVLLANMKISRKPKPKTKKQSKKDIRQCVQSKIRKLLKTNERVKKYREAKVRMEAMARYVAIHLRYRIQNGRISGSHSHRMINFSIYNAPFELDN